MEWPSSFPESDKYFSEAEISRRIPEIPQSSLGGRFGYFYFFPARGGAKGSPRREERRGDGFFIENPRRGGFQEGEGPGGCLRRSVFFFLGGGPTFFLGGGRNVHQVSVTQTQYLLESMSANLRLCL